jgi:hypothetical protein
MAYSDEISPKQKHLIEKLMASLPAKLDAAQGTTEATQVTEAVAEVQEVLVRVLSGAFVTVGEARPLIGVLIDADKLLGMAVAKAVTPGITHAERIIPNKFAKACVYCNEQVEAEAGYAALLVGLHSGKSWNTICATCAAEAPEVRSERLSATPAPVVPDVCSGSGVQAPVGGMCPTCGTKPEVHREGWFYDHLVLAPVVPAKRVAPQVGVYTDPAGGIVRIYQGTYKLNGKRNDGSGWRWTGNRDFAIAIPENKITAAEAAAFGHSNNECVFCGIPLTDPRSTETGYGKICAGHNGLPWGTKNEVAA